MYRPQQSPTTLPGSNVGIVYAAVASAAAAWMAQHTAYSRIVSLFGESSFCRGSLPRVLLSIVIENHGTLTFWVMRLLLLL